MGSEWVAPIAVVSEGHGSAHAQVRRPPSVNLTPLRTSRIHGKQRVTLPTQRWAKCADPNCRRRARAVLQGTRFCKGHARWQRHLAALEKHLVQNQNVPHQSRTLLGRWFARQRFRIFLKYSGSAGLTAAQRKGLQSLSCGLRGHSAVLQDRRREEKEQMALYRQDVDATWLHERYDRIVRDHETLGMSKEDLDVNRMRERVRCSQAAQLPHLENTAAAATSTSWRRIHPMRDGPAMCSSWMALCSLSVGSSSTRCKRRAFQSLPFPDSSRTPF